MICLYLKIPENFVHLILQNGFWFMLISFGSRVKFPFLAENYYYDHYYSTPCDFFTPTLASFLRSPALFSPDIRNAVVWMVLILPLISNSSNSFSKLLGTVLSAPTTTGHPLDPHIPQLFLFLDYYYYHYFTPCEFFFTSALAGGLSWDSE